MSTNSINKKKVYFISGGGTGGHIYPAVSIMEELLNQEDTEKIYYIGNPKNLEFNIVSKNEKITFLPVNVTGMPRKIGLSFILWLFKLEVASWKALFYLLKYKPDAIFTTGGYVSAPILFAAVLAHKPFMMHDCDAVPGLVSRFFAPFAKTMSVAFAKSKDGLDSKNIMVEGNPIRNSFATYSKESAREKLGLRNKFTILAMGGSQGAAKINDSVIEMAQAVTEELDIQLIIQTGKKNFDAVVKRFEEYFPNYYMNTNLTIRPYFDEMAIPLKAADIVIARAGSLSLSEIELCGLPSILVPYPYAAADHQRKNAKEMEQKGAAIYLENDDCTRDNLLKILKDTIYDYNKMKTMSDCAYKLAKPESNKAIIEQLKSIIR